METLDRTAIVIKPKFGGREKLYPIIYNSKQEAEKAIDKIPIDKSFNDLTIKRLW